MIGTKVKYYPVTIENDKPTEGIVKDYEPEGKIFNQPMIVIDTVDHWIPLLECEYEAR